MIFALTGFMASGKTSFGRAVADNLGYHFIDLDKMIEERYGTPAEIFSQHGEAFFRDMESRCLREALSCGRDTILALGGGSILRDENRRVLKASAKVIWLATSIEIILSELDNTPRPLVKGLDRNGIEALYDSRKPLYKEIADSTVVIDSFDYSIAIGNLQKAVLALKGGNSL
ncbi:MAG: shikimate kinase [Bacteroidales bacterium]|nr:shikimate kinase [Candidatus Cacconaster merdequi]